MGPSAEADQKLTPDQLERGARTIALPGIGVSGQRLLRAARALVIGAGGLGSPVLQYLAAAGVGTIGIVDFDVVDLSNLQRQVIHAGSSVGEPKTLSATRAIAALDPSIAVVQHDTMLTADNALAIFADYDLIVDGSDNFATRYLANDAAAILHKPYVWGSVLRFDGQVTVFWEHPGGESLDYRDVDPYRLRSCINHDLEPRSESRACAVDAMRVRIAETGRIEAHAAAEQLDLEFYRFQHERQ